MTLYHFTAPVMTHLGGILADGFIRTCESNITPDGAGPPVVWLTSDPDPTGHRWARQPGQSEGQVSLKVCARLMIDESKIDAMAYVPWAQAQGIDPAWLQHLCEVGGGGHDSWFVVERRVWKDAITALKFELDTVTRSYEGADLAQLWTSAAGRRALGLPKNKARNRTIR